MSSVSNHFECIGQIVLTHPELQIPNCSRMSDTLTFFFPFHQPPTSTGCEKVLGRKERRQTNMWINFSLEKMVSVWFNAFRIEIRLRSLCPKNSTALAGAVLQWK